MIKNAVLAITLATFLAGCATDPAQFSTSMNNAVENTHTAAIASVSVGTDIIKAVLALIPAVMDVVGIWNK